jgi:hypothetical protein
MGSRYTGRMRLIALALTLLIIQIPEVAAEPIQGPSKAARQGFVERFNELAAASNDAPFLIKLGKPDTTLSVVVTSGSCTRRLLGKIVELAGQNMRNVGFTLVECSSDKTINVEP